MEFILKSLFVVKLDRQKFDENKQPVRTCLDINNRSILESFRSKLNSFAEAKSRRVKMQSENLCFMHRQLIILFYGLTKSALTFIQFDPISRSLQHNMSL